MKSFAVCKKILFVSVFVCLLLTQCDQPGNIHNNHDPINRNETHLIYTRHARCRMDCRHITETEIKEILQRGEIDYKKSEPDGHPDPKYALEGNTNEGQHLRIIFAPTQRGLVVITCIELGVEWQCDCN
jgi:Domain of unknown function (DUF4258)